MNILSSNIFEQFLLCHTSVAVADFKCVSDIIYVNSGGPTWVFEKYSPTEAFVSERRCLCRKLWVVVTFAQIIVLISGWR